MGQAEQTQSLSNSSPVVLGLNILGPDVTTRVEVHPLVPYHSSADMLSQLPFGKYAGPSRTLDIKGLTLAHQISSKKMRTGLNPQA